MTPQNLMGLEPFWSVPRNEPLLALINNFMKGRIHRVPIVGDDNHISGSVTQSDVVQFLFKNEEHFHSVMKKTLKELDLEEGSVVSVIETQPLIKALSTIVETQFTGLAVIDSQGKLVGNVSASDVKGLSLETFNTLNLPIRDFVKHKPVCIQKGSTMRDVISKIVEYHVHRVFVVDDANKLLNVISLTSVLKAFGTPSENLFAGGRLNVNPEIAH